MKNLKLALKSLPSTFYQISITGNEPMLSPLIDDVLDICRKGKDIRYKNIVLTTNGTELMNHTQKVVSGVHHINVSCHHYDFEENKKIFKGSWNFTDEELENAIDFFGKNGIDVSLACVINDNTSKYFIDNYIDFAKRIGAYAVRFRKENGTLDKTPVENIIAEEYPSLNHGACPVCRSDFRVIKGCKTHWLSSLLEPTDKINDKVYELIFDTDGKLYQDWNRMIPYTFDDSIEKNNESIPRSYDISRGVPCSGSSCFSVFSRQSCGSSC